MEEAVDSRLFEEGSESPRGLGDRSSKRVAKKDTKLSVVSLFAGIGGFDIAFESAGGEVLLQCENDKYCQAVLRRHWPSAILKSDIRLLDAASIPDADVWTAGFPCQDVSLARGNHGRNGLKGNHTSLFFELMALVELRKPKVIVLENVVGLLNSHQGCDFAIILRELTSRGYAVAWRVLNARYFGAPQSRSRVFLCAWLGNPRRAALSLFEPDPSAKLERERTGFLTPSTHSRTGAIVPEVAYCLAATSGRHTGNDWSRSYVSYKDRVRRPTPTESERLQGFPENWTVPASDYRPPARGLDSERYRAIGNAVAVPVVRWVAERIKSVGGLPSAKSSGGRFPKDVLDVCPELRVDGRLVDFAEIHRKIALGGFSYRWKNGGCAWGDEIVEGGASPAPAKIIASKFVDLLDPETPDDKYFLTANAAVGIIRRADVVGRTLFPPMRAALEAMVKNPTEVVASVTAENVWRDQGAKSSVRPTGAYKRGKIKTTRPSARRALRRAD